MSNNLSNSFSDLSDTAKKYIHARIDLVKLTVLGKITRSTSFIVSSLVIILLGMLVLLFSLAAFVVWYGQVYHDYLTGLLLAIGILVVVAILFMVFRKQLITSTVLRMYSSILFEDDDEEEVL